MSWIKVVVVEVARSIVSFLFYEFGVCGFNYLRWFVVGLIRGYGDLLRDLSFYYFGVWGSSGLIFCGYER